MRRNCSLKFNVLYFFTVFFYITVISGCTGTEAPVKEGNQTTKAATQAQTTQPSAYKVGDTIRLGDNRLTINETKKSQGKDYDKPKSGNEFVIVKVTIENAGKSEISYNPFDFKIQNSQGQITDYAFTTVNQDTALQSGDLAPGGKVSGTLAFEAPKNDPKLQLQYKPGFFSGDMIKVDL